MKNSRRRFLQQGLVSGVLASGLGPNVTVPVQGEVKKKRLEVKIAGYGYDRVQGLKEGRVEIPGMRMTFEESNIYALNNNAIGGAQKWEVQEIGLHPYMLAYANDSFRDYTLVPVFPLRTFRHKSMFIRTDRGIRKPEDLRGRKVATPGYSQSSLTWIRGILQSEYKLKPHEMNWVLTTSSDKGKPSKNESLLPEGIPVEQGPIGKSEAELLLAGEVDAAFVAHEPKAFMEGHPEIGRLFPDYQQAEAEYYQKTGIFPIMHVVAIRKEIVQAFPDLPVKICKAYSAAKQMMYQELQNMGWAMISLPWISQELERTRKLMGENYWSYGIKANRKTLEALFQYSYEQGLSQKLLTIEELFHPSTLDYEEPIG